MTMMTMTMTMTMSMMICIVSLLFVTTDAAVICTKSNIGTTCSRRSCSFTSRDIWDNNVVPGPEDVAVINSTSSYVYTIDIDSHVQLQQLIVGSNNTQDQISPSITVSQTLTVDALTINSYTKFEISPNASVDANNVLLLGYDINFVNNGNFTATTLNCTGLSMVIEMYMTSSSLSVLGMVYLHYAEWYLDESEVHVKQLNQDSSSTLSPSNSSMYFESADLGGNVNIIGGEVTVADRMTLVRELSSSFYMIYLNTTIIVEGEDGLFMNNTDVVVNGKVAVNNGNITLYAAQLMLATDSSLLAQATVLSQGSGLCGQGSIDATTLQLESSNIGRCLSYEFSEFESEVLDPFVINADVISMGGGFCITASTTYNVYRSIEINGDLNVVEEYGAAVVYLPFWMTGGWGNEVNFTDAVSYNNLITNLETPFDAQPDIPDESLSVEFPPFSYQYFYSPHSISVMLIYFTNPSPSDAPIYKPWPNWLMYLLSFGLGLAVSLLVFFPGKRLMNRLFPREEYIDMSAMETPGSDDHRLLADSTINSSSSDHHHHHHHEDDHHLSHHEQLDSHDMHIQMESLPSDQ
eukprot:TRINITY_DN260_c0_g3_i1.p1 TRINITY_DN260_c0_g3~~TRINITY_DN260_c0_g3_i1.p1  ORF type:complete len:618 (-),score=87.25 TRINITY_DN260_c0_g3_i1:112-1845(-)